MDLLEYQAKELFSQMGIPILPSQRIDHPRDLKGLKIPYPVVLKSQVYAGGRAKLGGIRFVENTIDAVAAAQTIFNLSIVGQHPSVLLAEAKYEPERELYLAIALDQSSRRPILLGSAEGGVEIEAMLTSMQQVLVDQDFSPFYARRLAIQMGLTGTLIETVSAILEKMYRLFVQKDLDLIEINPLAVSPSGEVMALDGKVTVNDNALGRHQDLLALEFHSKNGQDFSSPLGSDVLPLGGQIGIVCNGAGLLMATLDLVAQAKGKPGYCLNLGGACRIDLSSALLHERVTQGLELVTQSKGVRVVLVNILGSVVPCDAIAQTIVAFVERSNLGEKEPPLVVRLVGNRMEQARDILATVNVPLVDDLDQAIAKTVSKARKS